MDLLLSLFPDETEKWQSRFQPERKAKEAHCIIAEKTPSKRDLSFCLSSGKAKNPENPVDPVYVRDRAPYVQWNNFIISNPYRM